MDEITVIPSDKGAGSVFVKSAPTEKTDAHDAGAIEKPTSQRNEVSAGERTDVVIVTGADVSTHLIPIRDDFDEALTFRSILLATILAAFQAVMNQIYTASSPTNYVPFGLVY